MSALLSGQRESVSLPKYNVLTVVANSSGSGRVTRLPEATGGNSGGFTDVAGGETKTFGPYSMTTQHLIEAFGDSITWSTVVANFPAADADVQNIVQITQEDYDLLSPPDPHTLYLVVG